MRLLLGKEGSEYPAVFLLPHHGWGSSKLPSEPPVNFLPQLLLDHSNAILDLEFFLQEACPLPDCIRQIRKWYILIWNPYSLSGVAITGSIIPFISNHSWKLGPFSGTESIPVNLPFLPSLIKLCSHFVNSSAVIVFLTPVYGTYTVGFSLFVSGCPWVCNMCL